MAKPENSIKKIKLPGENTARDIIPDSLGSGSYIASLPTLTKDEELVTASSLGAQVIELEDNGTTTAGTWLAKTDKISSLQAGQIFLYKITVAGTTTTTTLNISINGTATGAKTIYRAGTTKLTTQYAVGAYILLYFSGTDYYVFNDYDANADTKVRQYKNGSTARTAPEYPILTRYNVALPSSSYEAAYARFNTDAYINTTTGYIYAPKLYSNNKEVLTDITGSMVTTALGYTPADSASLGTAAAKDFTTSVTSGSTDLVTSGAVYTAIDNLPEPMVFKGTLGTSGTITDLPAASSSNEGFTYKVITAGTYQSIVCKVGDVVVSNGSAWVLIPAGDTDSDTWRDIDINGSSFKGSAISTGKINFKNGSNVTITGSGNDITIAATDTTYESKSAVSEGTDVSLVTTGEKYIWNNKLDNHCVEVDISEVTPVIDGDLYTYTKNITAEEYNQISNINTYEIRVTTPQAIGLGTVPLFRITAYTAVGIFGNVLGQSPELNAVFNMRGLAAQTGATEYKFIFDLVANKYQTQLTSGTNIKTINNTSILGSGNIDVLTYATTTDIQGLFTN